MTLTRQPAREDDDPLLIVVIVMQMIQIVLFNTPFDAARLALAGASLVVMTVRMIRLVQRRDSFASGAFLFTLTMLVGWVFSALLFHSRENWSIAVIQVAFPIYLCAFGRAPGRRVMRVATIACAAITAYAVLSALLLPSFTIAGGWRPAGFMEPVQIHSAAYATCGILLFFWLGGIRRSLMPRPLAVVCVLLCLIMLVVYQVRTAQVMLLVFAIICVSPGVKQRLGFAPFLIGLLIVLAGLAQYAASDSAETISKISSGRTSVYQERLALIVSRPIGEIILGTGPGTDIFFSTAWWWDAKNSHNDFIGTVIERGLLGLGSLLAFILFSIQRRKIEPLAMLLAIYSTGLISNGLFQRPIPLFFAALALWVSVQPDSRREIKTRRRAVALGDGQNHAPDDAASYASAPAAAVPSMRHRL